MPTNPVSPIFFPKRVPSRRFVQVARSGRTPVRWRTPLADAGAAVSWTVPEEGTTDTLDALWIPQGVPESMIAPAMRYIDFALRPDIQQDWCSRLGVLPVHSDGTTPGLRKNCAQLPDTADDLRGILYVPERVKALHQLSWEQQFQNIFAHPNRGDLRRNRIELNRACPRSLCFV